MKIAKQKERELIIKYYKEGRTCRDIADLLDICKSKASFWINRYKKTGKLEEIPKSGRPAILTKEKLTEIYQAIKNRLETNENKSGISSKEVYKIIEQKNNKKYSLRHVQRILHKIGLSLITPRVSHIKCNKEAREKFKEELKKNFNRICGL